ncbi:hypothetical protein J6590_043086 [Homalodisca vitripennis]|nr:hypothetical protein J6590_043086 [Homalodisca vitripennis]
MSSKSRKTCRATKSYRGATTISIKHRERLSCEDYIDPATLLPISVSHCRCHRWSAAAADAAASDRHLTVGVVRPISLTWNPFTSSAMKSLEESVDIFKF